uniref:Histone domain-containing protein n=1 Tax=Parastrongyloides trichosuri TaxID=131310 RepID=A0A0N4ZS20_PARTI
MARSKPSPQKAPKPTQKARKSVVTKYIRDAATSFQSPQTSKRNSIVKKSGKRLPIVTATKKRRVKNGVGAIREIKKFQASTNLLVPRAPMVRCIREVMQTGSTKDIRITCGAIDAVREAVEHFVVDMFESCNLFALHAKRVTVMPRDIELWKRIKRMMAPSNFC